MKIKLIVEMILVGVMITAEAGCSNPPLSAKKLGVAKAMATAADNCLLDVRDNNTPYAKSPSCSSLDALSTQYFHEVTQSTVDLENQDFKEAQLSAWKAAAISNGKYRNEPWVDRIW